MSALHNAPELKLFINEKLVGYATGFRYMVTQGQKPIYGVDSPVPQEIAQGANPSIVEGSLTVFRPKNFSPERAGYMSPRTSRLGISEDGKLGSFAPNGKENPGSFALGSARYSTIRLEDRATGKTVMTAYYVMFGSQSWSVGERQVMQGSITFQAIIMDHPGKIDSFGGRT